MSLAALKQERDAIDTQASAYFHLARAREDATKACDAALAELSTKRGEAAQLRRLRAALPRMCDCTPSPIGRHWCLPLCRR